MVGLIVLAALISYLLTPVVIKLALRFGLVTDAKSSKHPAHTHQGILPRAGGLPIFLGFAIAMLWFVNYQIITFILLGALVTVLIGLLDDKYDLSPYLRFGTNILVAVLAVSGGLGIPYLTNPFNGLLRLDQFVWTFTVFGSQYQLLWLADLVAVLWIVWCMNMINWS